MAFPTTSPPTFSAPWQVSLQNAANPTGLLLGQGTPYAVYDIEGAGSPTVETGDISRPRDQGLQLGSDYLAGRDLVITGDIVSDGTSLQHAVAQLAIVTTTTYGYASTEYPMWINVPNLITAGTNTPIASMVRPRKKDLPFDLGFSINEVAQFTLQMSATDPRFYSLPNNVTTTATGSTVNAVASMTNAGNYETRPLYTITGPIASGWTLTTSSGGSLTVILALTSGQSVIIDPDQKTVVFNNGSTVTNARSYLGASPTWWNCPANATTTATLAGTGGTASVTSLNVEYCSAWIL